MAREFNVPPVVFPSGGANPSGPSINVQQRRSPSAPFQQPARPSSSTGIPFMSFDAASAAAAYPSGPIGGFSSAPAYASFEDEEPLLDELGIHPVQIWKKTRSILNPFRVNAAVHKDADLSGPIFLYLLFCLFQLLAGKIQFGVILGWIVFSFLFLYTVFKMIAGRGGSIEAHTCLSIVGYCLLPVVIFSAVSLLVPFQGILKFVMAGVFVLWASRSCTNLLVALAEGCEEHRGLIAYPCFLIYSLFSLLVIF